MITLKTNHASIPDATPEFRRDVARKLARFFPEYEYNKPQVPYPVSEVDGAYVIDGHNDWTCCVDLDDSSLVHITYREAARNPGVEFAFANWVRAITRWTIKTPEADRVTGYTTSDNMEVVS